MVTSEISQESAVALGGGNLVPENTVLQFVVQQLRAETIENAVVEGPDQACRVLGFQDDRAAPQQA